MFGMSMTEVVIILVIALLVLGPKELPKAAKAIGKTLREVRRAGDDLRTTFEREVLYADEKQEVKRPVKAPEGAVAAGASLDESTADAETPALAEANAPPAAPEDAPKADASKVDAPRSATNDSPTEST